MDKEKDPSTYNGWTNYETWTVGLWLDNEESSQHYWRQQAQRYGHEAPDCSQVRDGVWTADEAARFNLADQVKEEITTASPLQEPSLYGDLLNAALSEVNWIEIAGNWLNE